MAVEPDGDPVLSELTEVQRLLDGLVERRLARHLSPPEQEEFDRLVKRERTALDILARRRSSAGNGDEHEGQLR